MSNPTQDIPFGYCQCGCGRKTTIATRNRTSKGMVKGQPFPFVTGHYKRNRDNYCDCGRYVKRGYKCPQCHPDPAKVERDNLAARGYKRCSRCKQVFPLSEFQQRKERKSGYRSDCRSCATADHQKWVSENTEHLNEYTERNKEHKSALGKQWYQENKQRRLATSKAWKERNQDKERRWQLLRNQARPDIANAHTQRRRARKLALPSTFTADHWQAALAYWQGRCAYCGNQQGLFKHTKLSMEHFVSLISPGCPGTTPDNMLPVCLSCNSSRKSQDHLKWLTAKFGKRHAKATLAKIAEYFATLRDGCI